MKKFKFSSRVLAFVLAFVMIASLLPMSTLAATIGNIVTNDRKGQTGIVESTLNTKGTINWPVKIYDYLSDGMLFEFAQNASSASGNTFDSSSKTSGSNGGGQYVLGQPMPYGSYTVCNDYTTDVAYSDSAYNYAYNTLGYGTNFKRTKVAAVDYSTPMHQHLTFQATAHDGNSNYYVFYQSTTTTLTNTRYMVLVYRSKGIPESGTEKGGTTSSNYTPMSFLINGNSSWIRANATTWKNSETWTYVVYDLYSMFGANYSYSNLGIRPMLFESSDYLDIAQVAFFTDKTLAETYGKQCVVFNNEPGEYVSGTKWNAANNTAFGFLFASNGGSAAYGNATQQYYTHQIGYRIPDYKTDAATYNDKRLTGKDATTGRFNGTGTAQGANGIYYIDVQQASQNGYQYSDDYQADHPNATTYDMSELDFGGYKLLTEAADGLWTAGLLQNKLSSDGIPQYKQETVEYLADMLSKTLTIPKYGSNGYANYNYVAGVKNRDQFGNTNGVANDLAQGLRNVLGITFSGNSKAAAPKMGTYAETLAKADKLTQEKKFIEIAGNINTCMDAAYYLLHNLFIGNTYNQQQNDFSYLTLSSAELESGGTAYVFDGGFSQGASLQDLIDGDLTQAEYMAQSKSAVEYSGYNSNGDGTISHKKVDEKDKFYWGTYESSNTTRFPFLPVVDPVKETPYYGQTDSYYFAEDGKRSFNTELNTYYGRNFGYTMVSNGEFVFHKEDDLFFEFEGDDDVYLFINGELVLDIGGGHSISNAKFNVNKYVEWAEGVLAEPTKYTETDIARANALNLEDGEIASFDFYYMERHGYGANCRIVTNMHITDPSLRVEKKAYQNGEEIDYGGLVDGATPIEYKFVANNGGNTKLYNFTFDDADIGVTLSYETGLTVKEGNNKYIVCDARMEELDAHDLKAKVKGYKKVGTGGDYEYNYLTKEYSKVEAGTGEFIYAEVDVNFDSNDDLIKFLKTLQAKGTDTTLVGEEMTQSGAGLWKDASLEIGGIYYIMTDTQRDEGIFENIVYVTATSKANTSDAGCETKRSDDNHRVYITALPYYYQWKDNELFVPEIRIFDDASKESGEQSSMLYDYHQFFMDVADKAKALGVSATECITTVFCDKNGNRYYDYTSAYEHVTSATAKDGTWGFKANYDTTGIHEFYLLMGKNSKFGDAAADLSDISELTTDQYAIVRVIIIVADTQDATYILDYGLKTENLDSNGVLFKDDELLGKLGGTKAKLMGINTTGGSYVTVSDQQDYYNRLDFSAMALDEHNQIYVNGSDGKADGLYTFNMNIGSDGKEITYNAVSGLYSLTDSGTTLVHAEVPSNWEELYLYYWYDDNRNNGWPGEPMTRNSWGNFSLNIPGNVPHIIINAKAVEDDTIVDKKSADITINPGHEVWIDFGDGTSTNSDGNYLAEAKYKSKEGTIHASVPSDWEEAYFYCWDAFGNGLTAWPGEKITEKDADGNYTFNILGDITNVIINNGDNKKQTVDLVVFAGEETWIVVDSTSSSTRDDGVELYYAKTSRSQEAVTFHATVPSDWDTAFLYYWNSNNAATKVDWPGLQMTKDDNGVYYLDGVPADVNNVIINNGGNGKQTVDLLVTPGLETWITVNEASAAKSLFMTVPDDWGEVYVHFFDNNGGLIDGVDWPGRKAINLYGNKYFIQIPFGATKYVVNNNNNGQQTQDLLLIPQKDTNVNVANYNAQATTSSKVTITAPESWTTLNVYTWNNGTNANNAEWPGVAVEKNTEGKFVYTIDKNFNAFKISADGFESDNLMLYLGDETIVNINEDGSYSVTSPTATDNKFTANIAYGVDAEQEGFSFTPVDFMDSEYDIYMALTIHEEEDGIPTALGSDINIGKEVQLLKKVTVLPASVVYYEDDFAGIRYNYTTANVVTHYSEGSGSLTQSIDRNKQYGNDLTYQGTENGEMTGGSLTDVYVNDTNDFATFNFTGTGFEIIGHTHAVNSGTLVARVYDKDNNMVKEIPVITEFDNGADGGTESIASIPLVRVSGLEYGKYTVKLSGVPVYDFSNWTDFTKDPPVKQSYLCIDGFRVYQPLKGMNTRELIDLDTYITVSGWHEHFADPADGIIVEGNDWTAGDWFGFKQGGNVDANGQGIFNVDLGDVYTITDLRAHICSTFTSASIGNPQWIEIYYQTDETQQFKFAGNLDVTANPEEIYWAEWLDQNNLNEFEARYLKFKFGPGYNNSTWVMVDEIEVYGHDVVGGHDQYIKEESGASFTEVRKLISDRQAFAIKYDDTNGLSVSGGTNTWIENRNNVRPGDHNTKWTNNVVNSVSDYLLAGPNNEVYLIESTDEEKSAIAFYVTESDNRAASTRTMQVGIRAMDYNAFVGKANGRLNAEIQYSAVSDSGELVWRTLTTINTSSEQYYTIPYTECPYDADLDRYQVVLRVADTTPTGMASFTTLKYKGIELLTLNESEVPDVSYGEDMGNTLLDSNGKTLDDSKFVDFIELVDTMQGVTEEPDEGTNSGGTTTPTEPEEVIVGSDTSAMGALYDSFTADATSNFALKDTSKIYIVTDSEDTAPADKVLQTAQLSQQQFAADTTEAWGGCDMQVVWGLEQYATKGDIIIRTGSTTNGDEGFTITVTDRAVIECKDQDGMLYALNTLQKHFRLAGTNAIKGFTLTDQPDTKERTVHLDVARKYLTKNWICNYLAEMSWMGYNSIEFHMSEDGGFRSDIWSDETIQLEGMSGNDFSWAIGSRKQTWAYSGGADVDAGSHLSTTDLIEICNVAKKYHIDIIPSFDTPAHVDWITTTYAEQVAAGNTSIKTFNYNGTTYTLPNTIHYADGYSALNLGNANVKNLAYAMYNDIAVFFKHYAGSTKFNIGGDELGLYTSSGFTYTDVYNYINAVNAVLRDKGYTARVYNDFFYRDSTVDADAAIYATTAKLDSTIEVVIWTTEGKYTRDVADWKSEGRTIYNGMNYWTYYVLRYFDHPSYNNSSYPDWGKDARDPSNHWWSFYCNDESITYQGSANQYSHWNPTLFSPPDILDVNSKTLIWDSQLGGGYFMVWCDNATVNTEVEMWNGVTDRSTSANNGKYFYSLINRMWSNAAKQWDWTAHDTAYSTFETLRTAMGYFPGYVETTSGSYANAMSLPATQEVEGQYRTYHDVTFVNYDGTVLQTVSVKEGTDAVYTGATPTREADVWKTYTFSGWDKELTGITGPTTFVAQYTETTSASGITGYLELKSSGGSNIELSIDNGTSKPVGLNYSNSNMKFGKAVTVKAITNNDYQFIGWVNAMTGEIASTSATYSFYTSGNDVLIAMYAVDDADGKSLVTFRNDKTNQIIDMQYYSADDYIGKLTFPNDKVADYPGYEHTGWDHTSAQIAAAIENGENITVTTTWTAKAVYFKVVVNGGSVTDFVSGGVDDMYRAYKATTITADDAPSGQKFAYWTDEQGRIVSYKAVYKMFPHKNTELTAVYVPSSQTVSGIVSTAYIDAETLGDANTVFFTWDATSTSYEVLNTGVLLVKKQHYYPDTFKVGTVDENVLQFVPAISHKTTKAGSYSVTIPQVASGDTWVAMSFVQYRDADGIVRFAYSELAEATK